MGGDAVEKASLLGHDQPLPLTWMAMFGFANFPHSAMFIGTGVHLNKFYTDDLLVKPGVLAFAIVSARALDAILDPFLGWYSDRLNTRWGRRRPLLFSICPFIAVTFWLLMSPPRWFEGNMAAAWFGVFFSLYLALPLGLITQAFGTELTRRYHERTSLFAFHSLCGLFGTVCAAVAPGVMSIVTEDRRFIFSVMAFVVSVVLVISYWGMVAVIKEKPHVDGSNPLVPGLRMAIRNKPFKILLTVFVIGTITGTCSNLLMPFFVGYIIRPDQPDLWLSIYLVTFFLSSILSIPLWWAVSRLMGKRFAWLLGFGLNIPSNLGVFFVGEGDVYPFLALVIWSGLSGGGSSFLHPALQGDVIEYDELYTGKRREGQYMAFWALVPKLVSIPASAVPFAILGDLGYVPDAPTQPNQVLLAIRALCAFMPGLLSCVAFCVAFQFPINEDMHTQISECVRRHRDGQWVEDPLTHLMLPPPTVWRSEEKMWWFLNYFSKHELRRLLSHGPKWLQWQIWLQCAVSIAVCMISLVVAIIRVSIEDEPGLFAVLSMVLFSFSLAVFVFHILRLRAAMSLRKRPIAPDRIRAFLVRYSQARPPFDYQEWTRVHKVSMDSGTPPGSPHTMNKLRQHRGPYVDHPAPLAGPSMSISEVPDGENEEEVVGGGAGRARADLVQRETSGSMNNSSPRYVDE